MPSAVIHRSKLLLSHCISLFGGSNHGLGSGAGENLTKDDEGVQLHLCLSSACLFLSVSVSLSL